MQRFSEDPSFSRSDLRHATRFSSRHQVLVARPLDPALLHPEFCLEQRQHRHDGILSVKTSAKVRHYVPDAVVSSYSSTGENPWTEVRALSAPTSGAQGGGSGTTNSTSENSLSVFKNVDVIGHPGIAAFNAFASGSGYTCEGAGTPYMPNFLSTLDPIGWRHGIPESVFPQSLIPGMREVGSRLSMNPAFGKSLRQIVLENGDTASAMSP